MEKSDILLGDGATRVIINSRGNTNLCNSELKSFLDYINGTIGDSRFVRALDEKVQTVKISKERRKEFMTLSVRDYLSKEEGREEVCWRSLQSIVYRQSRFPHLCYYIGRKTTAHAYIRKEH